MRKCRIGTAKFFTLLLLPYRTSVKSQGIKQLVAGGGVALIGMTLVPLLSGLLVRRRVPDLTAVELTPFCSL